MPKKPSRTDAFALARKYKAPYLTIRGIVQRLNAVDMLDEVQNDC